MRFRALGQDGFPPAIVRPFPCGGGYPRCDLAAAPPLCAPQLVVGIDLGRATASCCAYSRTKVLVLKPFDIPNDLSGFRLLQEKLAAQLPEPAQILIGFEATGRYGDAL